MTTPLPALQKEFPLARVMEALREVFPSSPAIAPEKVLAVLRKASIAAGNPGADLFAGLVDPEDPFRTEERTFAYAIGKLHPDGAQAYRLLVQFLRTKSVRSADLFARHFLGVA